MNRKTPSRVFIGILFISALTGATPDIAFAVPKGGGKCACMCTAPNGVGGTLAQSQTYNWRLSGRLWPIARWSRLVAAGLPPRVPASGRGDDRQTFPPPDSRWR
jgi:hypothetical protein